MWQNSILLLQEINESMATKKLKKSINMIKLIIDDTVDGRQIVFVADDLIQASTRLGFVATNSFDMLKEDFEKKFGVTISILDRYIDTEKDYICPL